MASRSGVQDVSNSPRGHVKLPLDRRVSRREQRSDKPLKEYLYSSLSNTVRVLWKWRWMVLLAAVVLAGVEISLRLSEPPMYEASVVLSVNQKHGTSGAAEVGTDSQQLLAQEVLAYGLSNPPALDYVVGQLNSRITPVDFSRENLSIEQNPETQSLQVSYRDPSPEKAQRIANTLGEVFSKQLVPEISKEASEANLGTDSITATVEQWAVAPSEPVSPNPVRAGLLGMTMGLMLGVGLALVFERVDRKGQAATLTRVIITGIAAFVIVFGFLRPFVGEAFVIPSESMVPTLEVGDRVIVAKFVYRFSEPHRGDIVVFEGVGGETENLIKRVVGVAGDDVRMQDGVLFVNRKPQKEPYLNAESPSSDSFAPVVVPEGHVFVMGDNRGNSADSRVFGPVPLENLKGKALLRFWPVSKIGIL